MEITVVLHFSLKRANCALTVWGGIILFEASARALKTAGVGDKLPDLAKLREEYSRLSEEKDLMYAEYGSLKKRMQEYDAVKQNIDSILSPNRVQEQDNAL